MSSANPFVEFPAGEVIVREGEPASALFIIDSGTVSVARADHPQKVLAQLGPGDFFGEMSILQEQAHSASVTAIAPVRALRIDAAAFHGVLRENVEIAVLLMRRLVLRLQASDAQRSGAAVPAADTAPAVASDRADPPAVDAAAQTWKASAIAGAADVASPPSEPPSSATAPPPTVAVQAPAAAPSAAIALVLKHAEGEIEVPAGKSELLVGRPDPATGAIPDINLGPLDTARTLSRRHARLLLAAGRWVLREEPGVGNGTWVNGDRLQPEQTISIKAGDRLRFGAIEVELVRD